MSAAPPTFRRSTPKCEEDLRAFYTSLASTVRWASYHADADDPAYCLKETGIELRMLEASYFNTVSWVLTQRNQLLDDHPAKSSPANADEGRLLVYNPEAGGCDAAAEVLTGGLLDVFFAPPPATWVAMFGDTRRQHWFDTYLVAWIPDVFVELVDSAIKSESCEGAIAWLEDSYNALSIQLFGDRYAIDEEE